MSIRENDGEIAALGRKNLESVVRVDSQSDERSATIPSSEGQRELSQQLRTFFSECGAEVSVDENANVVARLAGRGAGADGPPVALMVHLDTARGSEAVPTLELLPRWDGSRIPYPANERLQVDIETYPATRTYLGHDLLYGPGRAPMGLDDKLGLAHMMTLAELLKSNPEVPHPPLLLVGRPDEEIGRMEAVEGLAKLFSEEGVAFGYTLDGILPFEVNVENFNASGASMVFTHEAPAARYPIGVALHIGGVNTHGCTAKEEGYRSATRLAAEIVVRMEDEGLLPDALLPASFTSNLATECNGVLEMMARDEDARAALVRVAQAVFDPHIPRGASLAFASVEVENPDGAVLRMLHFVRDFYRSSPGFVLAAEDSEGFEGYSNLYRALPTNGGLRVDARLRDFDPEVLEQRVRHLRELAERHGAVDVRIQPQYVNMGPRLRRHPELVDFARKAGDAVGRHCEVRPIRGGTGVDPFLDRGIPVANLGTGYFALESEKEFTSMQMLAGHGRWLVELVRVIAAGPANRRQ